MSHIDEIKIATLNLFNYIEPPNAYYDFDNIYTHQEWRKKQAWIVRFLLKAQPDVIAFQEVFSGDALKVLLKDNGYPYFAIAGEPVQKADHVYESPVVAIASRYPIENAAIVKANPLLPGSMGLLGDFSYSRAPLWVSIKLPSLGLCDFYVVHLKSKRPMVDAIECAYEAQHSQKRGAPDPALKNGSSQSAPYHTEFSQGAIRSSSKKANEEADNVGQVLAENALGTWAASIQRGTEAAMLFSHIINSRQRHQQPFVLMGDFNDAISGDILSHLMTNELRFSRESRGEISDFVIKDAFDLYQASLDLMFELPRPATHYHGSKGAVLDYILLSSEFTPTDKHNMAVVTHYQIFDEHLVNPQYEQDSQSSDHAPVMISVLPRGC
ncbi:endonuclease/exonuclease/phosphatase family protein [uncultured Shewanella sp.]|uniref:endonuclease/exonuclease/phosphatase family protein n=1 Tax=uncultured Shewanella sp. TaxID=173975 RepID=UPI00263225D2|nr:endonuclease/exonuclease/phosphatase family protein [uncultured Shewanella sp.]